MSGNFICVANEKSRYIFSEIGFLPFTFYHIISSAVSLACNGRGLDRANDTIAVCRYYEKYIRNKETE